MTTLVIKNQGLIEPGDLTLIGSSTKRDDSTKIGMYGSGNKYALAWFLRNNIDIRIFSGTKEIELSHELVKHRDRDVAVLTVDSEKTSITSEMGPEWTGWMALREIISNAIDEGEQEITSAFNIQPHGIENETMIYIPLNNELNKVVREYDYYFAFDRRATYSNDKGSVYLKSEPSTMNFYRKGIRCYDSSTINSEAEDDKYWLDYNLENVHINESRVCSDHERKTQIKDFIRYADELPKEVLVAAIKDNLLSINLNDNHIPLIEELIKDGYTFTSQKMIKVFGEMIMGANDDKTLIIPHYWWESLAKKGILENPFSSKNSDFAETNTYDLSQINYLLMALGLDTDVSVFAGKYEYSNPLLMNNARTQFFIKDTTTESAEHIVALIIKELPTELIIKKFVQ